MPLISLHSGKFSHLHNSFRALPSVCLSEVAAANLLLAHVTGWVSACATTHHAASYYFFVFCFWPIWTPVFINADPRPPHTQTHGLRPNAVGSLFRRCSCNVHVIFQRKGEGELVLLCSGGFKEFRTSVTSTQRAEHGQRRGFIV